MRRLRLTVRHTSSKWLSRNADQCCLSLMALTPAAFCREYSPDPSGIAFAYARVSTLSLEGHRALAAFLHVTTELSQGRESRGRLAPVGTSSVSVAFLQGLARGSSPTGVLLAEEIPPWQLNPAAHQVLTSWISFAVIGLISFWDFWCCVKL